MSLKTILITIVDGFHYRYLMQTGIVKGLVNDNCHIVILAQEQLVNTILADFDSSIKLDVLPIKEYTPSFFQIIYLHCCRYKSRKLTDSQNIKNEQISFYKKFIFRLVLKFIPTKFIYFMGSKFFVNNSIVDVFEQYKPNLVIASTPAQKLLDIPVVFTANKFKVDCISLVYSWDNLTAKGPFAADVDHLIVWNDVLKREAIEYHGYDSCKVHVTGVPIYDSYRLVNSNHKDKFFNDLGLDNALPLVTIATIPAIYYGHSHRNVIIAIADAISQNLLPLCNILIRPHPMDETDYSMLVDYKNLNIKVDSYGSVPDQSLRSWKPMSNNVTHLGQTMLYSDVVLNVASTITIDASWFDTPVINIAIDYDDGNYFGPVARFYDYTHYKHVVKSGASDIIYNEEQLFKCIKMVLENPSHKINERKSLVDKMTMGISYKSVESTLKTINELLHEK